MCRNRPCHLVHVHDFNHRGVTHTVKHVDLDTKSTRRVRQQTVCRPSCPVSFVSIPMVSCFGQLPGSFVCAIVPLAITPVARMVAVIFTVSQFQDFVQIPFNNTLLNSSLRFIAARNTSRRQYFH
jgi:hypothetical protein